MGIEWVGLIVTLAVLSIALILKGLGQFGSASRLRDRLEEDVSHRPSLTEMELDRPFVDRAIKPIVRSLLGLAGRLAPRRNIEELERKLVSAGRPYGLSALDFLGVRVIAGLALGAVVGMVFQRAGLDYAGVLLRAAIFAALGMYLPAFWLNNKVSGRKGKIYRALPDTLDTLSVCVDAGLGFDAALTQVYEKFQNALADEFYLVHMEIRMGVARDAALRSMAERVNLRDLSTLVAAIIQAQELGVGLADTLRVQAGETRLRRSQLAEEHAQTLPVKMLFPLIFFIFPAIMFVVLGPSIPVFIDLFQTILGS